MSTVSDVIHDVHLDHGNRTPSRAGERKLPDIPYENHENMLQDNGGGSELYATLGSALADGGSDSEEAETEPTESNHPYAKGEKRAQFGQWRRQNPIWAVETRPNLGSGD